MAKVLIAIKLPPAGDTTPPTVTSSVINSAGTTLTISFDENITGNTGFTISPSGGAATLSSPSNGAASIAFTISRAIQSGETVTLNYSGGNVIDSASNPLATISAQAVTNSSSQGSSWDIEDNFEGGNPSGWDAGFTEIVPDAGAGTTSITTAAGGSISGSNAYQQSWDGGGRPSWLRYATSPVNGDVLEWDFWLKYHANFNANPPNIKLMTMRGASSEIYFESHDTFNGDFLVFIQNMPASPGPVNRRHGGNINGGNIFLNHGTWQHIVVQIKLAIDPGTANGFVYAWVDGVKRIEYDNIHTWAGGTWGYWQWETTTAAPYGANQKRWTDDLKFRVL